VFVCTRGFGGTFLHDGYHMCRLYQTLLQGINIDSLNVVYEFPIRGVFRVEIRTETSVDENLNHIAECSKGLEMKTFD
jgi:hypothetical protein